MFRYALLSGQEEGIPQRRSATNPVLDVERAGVRVGGSGQTQVVEVSASTDLANISESKKSPFVVASAAPSIPLSH
jgi:hypothetical protein